MNRLSRILLIFAFLVVLANFVYAADVSNDTLLPFKVSVETIKERIDFEENAMYKIIIENPRNTIEKFNIKPGAPYVEWFIKTDPVSDYSVTVYPNSKKEVMLIVKPLSVGLGRYSLMINVKHESGETFNQNIMVNVVSMSNLPAIGITGKIPAKIDPREEFVVTVWLENKNAKKLDGISVELRSDSIQDTATTSLGPIGSGDDKKTLEFSIKLDKKTSPRNDSLRIFAKAMDGDNVYEMKSVPYYFEIINYGGVVDNHNPRFRFLGRYDEITFVNDANTKFEGVAKIKNPFYRALFTKADPKPKSFVLEGVRYIGWDASLEPQESFDVVVKVNYIPLFILIAVILFILISYYVFRSPIVITKSVQAVLKSEGGIRQFKILLHVKNRSKKLAENVAVIDRIPDIADFIREEEAGTLQPIKVVHTKRGVVAKWVINSLDREEETVIKYIVRSRLSVLGKMPLPVAMVKCTDAKGNVKRGYSNRTSIHS